MTATHVLVALDGSRVADDALAHALDAFDCRITVLNVVTPLDGAMSEGATLVTDRERLDAAHDRTAERVETARRRSGPVDGRVETVVETGDPADVILAYAENHGVDHIVMGSHGDGGGAMSRRLFGTVATAVVGEASIPVTIVD